MKKQTAAPILHMSIVLEGAELSLHKHSCILNSTYDNSTIMTSCHWFCNAKRQTNCTSEALKVSISGLAWQDRLILQISHRKLNWQYTCLKPSNSRPAHLAAPVEAENAAAATRVAQLTGMWSVPGSLIRAMPRIGHHHGALQPIDKAKRLPSN
uniref:Uncharacterized protein n=1 Tax=Arundo donax TaxID=35708 RepID=A0A0A9GAY8_ARUDO